MDSDALSRCSQGRLSINIAFLDAKSLQYATLAMLYTLVDNVKIKPLGMEKSNLYDGTLTKCPRTSQESYTDEYVCNSVLGDVSVTISSGYLVSEEDLCCYRQNRIFLGKRLKKSVSLPFWANKCPYSQQNRVSYNCCWSFLASK